MNSNLGAILYAVLAATLGCVALIDVYLHGQLTLIDPRLVVALAVVSTGVLLSGVLSMHGRAEHFEERTDRLVALTAELKNVIAALETANKRLDASEARYKGLVDSQGDAIWRRDPDRRVTYTNKAFLTLFGVQDQQIIGTVFRPETHPEARESESGMPVEIEDGRNRVSYDQHVWTAVGYRWIAWEDVAIRDGDGRLIEIQSVGRDVTQRKESEALLTEAHDKAQDANRAKSQFLAVMSHEIRTPMHGVLGMARLLLETPLESNQETYAEAIHQSGVALLSLIEQLLDFSKIESGALSLECTNIELRPLIEDVAELLSTRAHSKNIDIATAVSDELPESILGDAIRLRQVLTNLVGNAIKFTDAGGVLISAQRERSHGKDFLRLTVQDTGIGVPREKQTQIFGEFVQVDSGHAGRFEGSGLGLSITNRLVAAMGGEVGMRDGENGGSEFWVTFPLARAAPATPKPLALEGKRIVVVSDAAIMRRCLKLQLAASGAHLSEAPDLETHAARKTACELIIVDAGLGRSIGLPDTGGLRTPTIILLPPEYQVSLSSLRDKGIGGYLTKPVRQASLEGRIQAVLAGRDDGKPKVRARAPEPRNGTGVDVLLAEDNPVSALLARELLRRRGHFVHDVTTGEDAVSACNSRSFDLVLMDLRMPGLDGIEATQRIRASEQASGARSALIYALTADALETGRSACLAAGMDGFLTKPMDPADLDRVLASVISAKIGAVA